MIVRFNACDLNCWCCQLGVFAKVTVLLNSGKWNSLVRRSPSISTLWLVPLAFILLCGWQTMVIIYMSWYDLICACNSIIDSRAVVICRIISCKVACSYGGGGGGGQVWRCWMLTHYFSCALCLMQKEVGLKVLVCISEAVDRPSRRP